MKYSQAKSGRVFVVRLEDGDVVHEAIEAFAKKEGITAASVIVVGAADKGSALVTGPERGRSEVIVIKTQVLDNVYEVAGTGTLFPNAHGEPVLHMHLACGRGLSTITGCVRPGVKVWQVMEVIVQEIVDTSGVRRADPVTGFELLNP